MRPEVDFPNLQDELEVEMRRAIVEAWWNGSYEEGTPEWGPECQRTFLDADGLGLGVARIGATKGTVKAIYHRLCDFIYDRHQWSVGRCRWVAFVHHIPVEEAVAMFGTKMAAWATPFNQTSFSGEAIMRVKMIEWFDLGLDRNKPTTIWFRDNIGGPVHSVEENEYECLPFAYCSHIQFYGSADPIGKIDLQRASQEMRNGIERYIKLTLQRGAGVDFIDVNSLHPEDVAAILGGRVLPLVKLKGVDDARKVFQRAPAQDIPPGVFEVLNLTDRDMNTSGGMSDADRANITPGAGTLGEQQLAKGGSDLQSVWSRKQYAMFLTRLIGKAVKIGSKLATAPMPVNIMGRNILLNDPANPSSSAEYWLDQHSYVEVNEDALAFQDQDAKSQQKLAIWGQFINDAYTNQIALREMIFRYMGRKDMSTLIDPSGQFGMGMSAPYQSIPMNPALQGAPGFSRLQGMPGSPGISGVPGFPGMQAMPGIPGTEGQPAGPPQAQGGGADMAALLGLLQGVK
jgi:hypothetical protein